MTSKCVTYSLEETDSLPPKADSYSKMRSKILSAPLSAEDEALFQIPLDKWRDTPRRHFSSWKCSISNPTDLFYLKEHPLPTFPQLESIPPVLGSLLSKLSIYRGPVTSLELDAIVNAANNVCLGGGGVDGAIHHAAGPLLQRECATFNGCPTGQSRLTKGYHLPAKFVIHTVGPVGEKPDLLRSCYRSIFKLMQLNALRTIGICCVSTGVYGYPLIPATKIAIEETFDFLKNNANDVDMICFACFQQKEYDAYMMSLTNVFLERSKSPSL